MCHLYYGPQVHFHCSSQRYGPLPNKYRPVLSILYSYNILYTIISLLRVTLCLKGKQYNRILIRSEFFIVLQYHILFLRWMDPRNQQLFLLQQCHRNYAHWDVKLAINLLQVFHHHQKPVVVFSTSKWNISFTIR